MFKYKVYGLSLNLLIGLEISVLAVVCNVAVVFHLDKTSMDMNAKTLLVFIEVN